MVKLETRILRFQDGYGWRSVEREMYKSGPEEGQDWQGIIKQVLIGKAGEATAFHVRYFEVVQGGYSSLEKHDHAHVVIAVRGHGKAILHDTAYELNPLDTVYVAPWTPHQFQSMNDEPFGFFCIVNAERDRPQPVSSEETVIAQMAGARSRP